MTDNATMDRNLALEAVRVTEAAALAASRLMGRGDEKAADQAAVDAMRKALNGLTIDGTVVIGEGERDEAPMLYIGEKVGAGHGPKIDIALDPLEGTTITAKGGQNALAVIAMAEAGGFLNAPDVYMDKIAIGGGFGEVVDLDETPATGISRTSPRQSTPTLPIWWSASSIAPRHAELIAKVREAGARIMLITDGDVAASSRRRGPTAASTSIWARAARQKACSPPRPCAASAAICKAACCSATTTRRARAAKWGVKDLNRKYGTARSRQGRGDVRRDRRYIRQHAARHPALRSAVRRRIRSSCARKTGTVRVIDATHNFNRKPQAF